MAKKEELILRATKEIVVKLIETGRVYPSSLEENYILVNRIVRDSLVDGRHSESILKATKEIVIKLIETGRVYPSSLEENYLLVNRLVSDSIPDDEGPDTGEV